MATQLGKALIKSSIKIDLIYNHQLESASILAKQLNSKASDLPDDLPLNSNLYIVALKDEHIISTLKKLQLKNKLIAHTSGTYNTENLTSISSRPACFYPMQSLKKNQDISLVNTPVFIEAPNKEDNHLLEKLCRKISCIPYEINFDQRQKLHIAAIATNNFTYHLFSCIQDYCIKHNLPYSSLKPLILQTINTIEKETPFEQQTGPAIRSEDKMIKKHLKILKNEKFLADIYSLFTKQIKKKHQNNEL